MNTSTHTALHALTAIALASLLSACQPQATPAPPAPTPPSSPYVDSLWDSRGTTDDARGLWFKDAKFGAFIHFGLYSHLGGYYDGKGPYRPAEQIMGLGDRHQVIPWTDYKAKVAANFNPARFDAARWVGLMKAAGQKYVILTAKHHDGFCMFKTSTTPFNVVDSTPFHRDIVRELSAECKKQGLVFCIYYSIGDWTAKDVMNPGFASYRDYMQAQLRELLTSYGDIKMLWFDNYWYVDNQWNNDLSHAKDLYAIARTISPNTLVNDRCGEGDRSTHGDYATPENQLKGSLQSRPFEVVMTNTNDDNWGWVKGAANYRTPAQIIKNLIDSASKGGNFVLNVGPDAHGEFPPEHVALLEAIGAWTRVNGEALYSTRPAPEISAPSAPTTNSPGDGSLFYATKSKDNQTYYLHVLSWPKDGSPLRFDRAQAPAWLKATLLDPSLGSVKLHMVRDAHELTLTKPAKLDPYATVIKLTPTSDGPHPQ